MLGAIKEVNEYDMVISLPNGLSGFVHITHINDVITERLKEELQGDDSKDTEVRFWSTIYLVYNHVVYSRTFSYKH